VSEIYLKEVDVAAVASTSEEVEAQEAVGEALMALQEEVEEVEGKITEEAMTVAQVVVTIQVKDQNVMKMMKMMA